MVNKPATSSSSLRKVSKTSMKIKKVKEKIQVNQLLISLDSIVPQSSDQEYTEFPEVDVIENAVNYIEKLKSQLSSEEVKFLDFMFKMNSSSNQLVG